MQLTSLESTNDAQMLLLKLLYGDLKLEDIHKHTNNEKLSTLVCSLVGANNESMVNAIIEINKELTVTPLHSQPLEFDEVVMGKLALMLALHQTTTPFADLDPAFNELYRLGYMSQTA